MQPSGGRYWRYGQNLFFLQRRVAAVPDSMILVLSFFIFQLFPFNAGYCSLLVVTGLTHLHIQSH